jgi:hypothetical protein
MFNAAVPEAAIDEYCKLQSREGYVRSDPSPFTEIQANVLPKAKTPSVQRRP